MRQKPSCKIVHSVDVMNALLKAFKSFSGPTVRRSDVQAAVYRELSAIPEWQEECSHTEELTKEDTMTKPIRSAALLCGCNEQKACEEHGAKDSASPTTPELKADDVYCTFAGPGRGDCEHFVGLPAVLDDTTTDCYGKPHRWCAYCWLSYRYDAVVAQREALVEIVQRVLHDLALHQANPVGSPVNVFTIADARAAIARVEGEKMNPGNSESRSEMPHHWVLKAGAEQTACGQEVSGVPVMSLLAEYVTCHECRLVYTGYMFGRADERTRWEHQGK